MFTRYSTPSVTSCVLVIHRNVHALLHAFFRQFFPRLEPSLILSIGVIPLWFVVYGFNRQTFSPVVQVLSSSPSCAHDQVLIRSCVEMCGVLLALHIQRTRCVMSGLRGRRQLSWFYKCSKYPSTHTYKICFFRVLQYAYPA